MTQQAHAERAHALLGASKAAQWINCPPSARLQDGIPETTSDYATEGTLAHELAEVKLTRKLLPCNAKQRKDLDKRLMEMKANPKCGQEMEHAIEEYASIVENRFMAAKQRSEDAVVILEGRLDFTEWVPDGFGTGDVVLIADGVLEIIDLKYGKGIPVSSEGNPQMRLYALGAWWAWNYLYDIKEVHMTIVQPRLDNVSTDIMRIDEIIDWAQNVVKPAAALADAGEGEFNPGDHCRWCKVKAICRARADQQMETLAYEFKEPALLTDEEIGSILYVAEQLSVWAKDVQGYAFERAKSGHAVPQWKLVEGRSNRAIADPEKVKAMLEGAGLKQDQYLKPQELYGIGELEKRVGKKELTSLIGDFIVKPPGKPVLVPESDKRPAINSVEQDFAKESFED